MNQTISDRSVPDTALTSYTPAYAPTTPHHLLSLFIIYVFAIPKRRIQYTYLPRDPMVNTDVLLEAEDLHTTLTTPHGELHAVDGVSFRIHDGETFALLGESGCGKSLTALSLMRLLPETGRQLGGSVRLNGEELLCLPETAMRQVRGRRLAMVFQEPQSSLNPVMTVGAQVAEPLRRHLGLHGAELHTRLAALFAQVGIPDPEQRLEEYPHQFSGGMKQRVMIAMALACQPDLLIADEPTTALDVTLQAQILALMKRLTRETGMAMLLITHDLGVVHEMADRVAVMYAGHLVEQAPRAQFFATPRHPYTRKLFAALPNRTHRDRALAVIPGSVPPLHQTFQGCRFAPRCDLAWAHCHDHAPRWLELSGGAQVRCHLYDPTLVQSDDVERDAADSGAILPAFRQPSPWAGRETPPLLEVRRLMVHFPIRTGWLQRIKGYIHAVDGVSLTVCAGHTVALVGESGCGKTTVGKGILQLLRPSGGRVLFDGVDLTWLSGEALRRRRRDLQVVFQDPYASMNPRMRVGEIIGEGMAALGVGGDATARKTRVAALLRQVGLSPDMVHRYPHEFSGGQRQRIALARALAVEPRLIVCDEPTSALDVSVQAQIINLLKELQDNLGIAYLFVTHNLSLVEYLAHSIAVMYLGRIVEQGNVDEVLKTPKHPYTRALLAAVPVIEPKTRREIVRLSGDPPSPATPPSGCYFHPRCPAVLPVCRQHYPCTAALSDTHLVHCHLYNG
ncbi:Glutathione import ATP-binding protein GsiA [Gammaproteobacteria bacterium]